MASTKAKMSADMLTTAKGVDSIVRDTTKDKKPTEKKRKPTLNETGECRATFIISEALLEQMKRISYWERILLKDILHEALSVEIKKREQKNGIAKPIPDKK